MKTIMLETNFFSFTVNFWFILLVTIVVLLIIILFFLFKWINGLDNSVDKLKEKIRYYDRDISDLKSDLKRLNATPVSNNQTKGNIQGEVVAEKAQLIEEEKSKPIEMQIPPQRKTSDEVFFMPSPSIEGYFASSDKSEIFKETITLYKFIIHKNNPNKADFEFNSDAMGIKNAVNYPDRYLEPVCIINSAYNPNTKKIININKGVADKIGDKWIVNVKAKIKYE